MSRPCPCRRRSRLRARLLPGCLAVLVAGAAAAHTRSISYSTIRVAGPEVRISFRMPLLEATRFPWALGAGLQPDARLAAYLTGRLRVFRAGRPCALRAEPRRLDLGREQLGFEWRLRCPAGDGPVRVESGILLDVTPSHLHFSRIVLPDRPPVEHMFTEGSPVLELAATASAQAPAPTIREYVGVGVQHILSGADHLLFVLALLLIGETLVETARIVTGFTVAHSITLAVAALGYVRPDAVAIQALVGLSIALVAAENLWLSGGGGRGIPVLVTAALAGCAAAAAFGWGAVPAMVLAGITLFQGCYFALLERWGRPRTTRWAVAFVFGLVHGFGFAGVLAEGALPPDRLLRGLLGFNAGVELGQLAVVLAVWPLLRRVGSHPRTGRWVVELGSTAVLFAGVFWFTVRAWG